MNKSQTVSYPLNADYMDMYFNLSHMTGSRTRNIRVHVDGKPVEHCVGFNVPFGTATVLDSNPAGFDVTERIINGVISVFIDQQLTAEEQTLIEKYCSLHNDYIV